MKEETEGKGGMLWEEGDRRPSFSRSSCGMGSAGGGEQAAFRDAARGHSSGGLSPLPCSLPAFTSSSSPSDDREPHSCRNILMRR